MSELTLDLPPSDEGRWARLRRSRPVGLTAKLAVIGLVVWVLSSGLSLLQDLVHERESRLNEVTEEIQSLWGYPQRVSGPVLVVPYGRPGDAPGIDNLEPLGTALFLPTRLALDAALDPQVRQPQDRVGYPHHQHLSETTVGAVSDPSSTDS